ncbi:MAG: NAAT family transporter [Gammaproteobacteria bacterium]|nr:MAG: NAAT family transporter [Gammaproteobacteria bacterium]
MGHYAEYAKVLTALFVIANPLGAILPFLTLTADQSEGERRRTARITALTVALVLLASAFFGDALLALFGIRIASFQVGGGILILLIAIAMLHARRSRTSHTPEEMEEAADKTSVGVVPLGVPLLAGPGAITTVIIYAHRAQDPFSMAFIVFSIALLALSIWIALRLAEPLNGFLGKTGVNIAMRLMGLLLAAIAIEFIAHGLNQLFPGLSK